MRASRSSSRRASSRPSCGGAHFDEVADITARICGICPVAYQMSSSLAMEDALGVEVDGPLRDLRRLIYCGEWVESHTLHVFMLHAPDFLGYESAIAMARDHREIVELGLAIKKAGNEHHHADRRSRGASDQRARGRLLPRSHQARACAAARAAAASARVRARGRGLDGGAAVPRLRARRRAGLAERARRVPDRPRAARLEPRPRHRAGGVRGPRGRGARGALERPLLRGCASVAPTSPARWRATG